MDNHSIITADLRAHLKMAMVSLIAAGSVVAVGIAARPSAPDVSTTLEVQVRVLKAGKAVIGAFGNQTKVR